MSNKKKVFVSFDYDKDKRFKYLLNAWDANPDFDFVFNDMTPSEIKTEDISRVKAGLTAKISEAVYTLVIIGEDANKQHEDYKTIGYKNWQNFEIAKSVEKYNKIIAVKLKDSYSAPEELKGHVDSWARSFSQESIIKALNEASKK